MSPIDRIDVTGERPYPVLIGRDVRAQLPATVADLPPEPAAAPGDEPLLPNPTFGRPSAPVTVGDNEDVRR